MKKQLIGLARWFPKHKKKVIFLSLITGILLILVIVLFSSAYHNSRINNLGNVQVQTNIISDANFIKAVKFDSLSYINNLLNLGANAKAVDANNKNTIILATLFRAQPEAIDLLVRYGADVNHQDIQGYNALMYSIIAGSYTSFLPVLLKNGANVNSVNDKGVSVLMVALGIANNNLDLAKLLISKGANINYSNKDGVTPLMVALRSSSNPKLIEYLISKGASVTAKDSLGISVADIFKSNEDLNHDSKLNQLIK